MLFYKIRFLSILEFSIIIFIFKCIPLYIIRKDTIKVGDIIVTLILFHLYLLWLYFNNQNLYTNTRAVVHELLADNGTTPGMYMFKQFEKIFKQ